MRSQDLLGLDVLIGEVQTMGPGGKNLFWRGGEQGPGFWNWENFWENWSPYGRDVEIEELDLVRGEDAPDAEAEEIDDDAFLSRAVQEIFGDEVVGVTKEDFSPYVDALSSTFTGRGAKEAVKQEKAHEQAQRELKTVFGVSLGIVGALAAGLLIYLAVRKRK